jgi:hypothetical protein
MKMIKLKEFLKTEQQPAVKPDAENPFEPSKVAPVKTAPVKAPVAKPASAKPVPKVSPAVATTDLSKIQNQIFNIKIRLNQLALNTAMKKFQTSLGSFKSKVTRNTKDNIMVQTYLSPLMGDMESLKGSLESLEAELKKLNTMTKTEEQ